MNEYSERRNRLMEQMEDNSLALLFSGDEIEKSEDEAYPFAVNRNFYYLSGIDKAGMVLALSKFNGVRSSRMFILPYDEFWAKWVGGRMREEEVKKISEVDSVANVNDLDDYVASLYNNARYYGGLKVYLDLWKYTFEQSDSKAIRYAKKLVANYVNTKVIDAYPILCEMRMVKDEKEVAKILKAIDITRSGVYAMMRNVKPKMNEMVMEGIFNFSLAQRGCNTNAFKTIAASGKRATILHYSDNNCVMEDGELFLCDLGATYDHYCADISRTFPVNGKFTARQKEIYKVVLGAQKVVENNVRPGVTTRDLNQKVIDYYKEELPKLGLNGDVSEYYFHGVSHHLGLDVHDVDIRGSKLKKGNVITNEPGLYIEKEGIGIRIEDDLLITDDGCINLAKDFLHDPDEIERFMNK